MNAPDVTVVVAVYNTMPYLTACLESLVGQSIGIDRLEVVAVDDGSTDGSERELDRFARAHPQTVRVVHQPNSGGPAAPSNRGLELATGRYVYFVGADDYLGREALQRLVAAADRYDADVVVGRMVGVNSRYVDQALFGHTEPDVDLFDSALPWALSNIKLFRREVIERYGLRFPEDMPVGSDQPFTFEACLRARRISVLADYDYYYAVKRRNAGNITYRSSHVERLRCAESIMGHVARLVEPGRRRDAILRRHFEWEVAKLLRDDFLRLDRAIQASLHAGVRGLAKRYLTDVIRGRLPLRQRVRVCTAEHGELDDLLAVIREDAQGGGPALVADGDRWYAAYPGFRDARLGLPDRWYDATEPDGGWAPRLRATSVAWEAVASGTRLTVTAHAPRADLVAMGGEIAMRAGETVGTTVVTATDAGGTGVRAGFDVDALLAGAGAGVRRPVRTDVRVFGAVRTAPLSAPSSPVRSWPAQRLVRRRGTRLYTIAPGRNSKGHLFVAVAPVTPRRLLVHLLRGLLRRGRQPA